MDTKKLLKILIGAAWIDGIIQPEERVYLRKMAEENDISEDQEIKLLLSEIKPIKAEICYQWLEEYLGEKPTEEDYQQLMNSISALIYSDGEVDSEEAKLLTRLQMLDPANETNKTAFDKLLKGIQKLYRQAIK
jgi:uncharacterized membrane protein YebE (DUF533 family)